MTANAVAAWAWILFYVGAFVADRRRPRRRGLDRLLDGVAAVGVTLVLLPPLPGWPLGAPWLSPGPALAATGLAVTGLGLALASSRLGRPDAGLRDGGILLAAAGTLATGADQAAVPGIALLAAAIAARHARLNGF